MNPISTSKVFCRIVNTATSNSPFELVYGFNHLTPLDLLPLLNIFVILNYDGVSKAQFVKDLYAKACSQIEKKVEQYANGANKGKIQKVHLGNKRFPNLRKSELFPRGDDPFKVIRKLNDNAYILYMSQTYEDCHTFLDHESNLRGSLMKSLLTSKKNPNPMNKTKRSRTLKHFKIEESTRRSVSQYRNTKEPRRPKSKPKPKPNHTL
ncbi:hypothetical protein CR513_02335, partial [Mucuna pruriens]